MNLAINDVYQTQQPFTYGFKRDLDGYAFPIEQRQRMSMSAKKRVMNLKDKVEERIRSTEQIRGWIHQIYKLMPKQLTESICDLRGLHLKTPKELNVIYKQLITQYELFAD